MRRENDRFPINISIDTFALHFFFFRQNRPFHLVYRPKTFLVARVASRRYSTLSSYFSEGDFFVRRPRYLTTRGNRDVTLYAARVRRLPASSPDTARSIIEHRIAPFSPQSNTARKSIRYTLCDGGVRGSCASAQNDGLL